MEIAGISIERIFIVDDEEEMRDVLEADLQDSKFNAVSQNEKVENLDHFIASIVHSKGAVVSDHQLMKKNYFPVNGAEVVANCYSNNIPAILVTKYAPHIEEIRRFRSKIPLILNPDEFKEETLIHGLELCIKEFRGELSEGRKPYRSLVRVDGYNKDHVYVVVPGWDQNKAISLNKSDLPKHIQDLLAEDLRLHAKVNIGCTSANELYFLDWESK